MLPTANEVWGKVMFSQGGSASRVVGYTPPLFELEKRVVRILLECFLVWSIFPENCMKIKEIGPGGGFLVSPLDPPMVGIYILLCV